MNCPTAWSGNKGVASSRKRRVEKSGEGLPPSSFLGFLDALLNLVGEGGQARKR